MSVFNCGRGLAEFVNDCVLRGEGENIARLCFSSGLSWHFGATPFVSGKRKNVVVGTRNILLKIPSLWLYLFRWIERQICDASYRRNQGEGLQERAPSRLPVPTYVLLIRCRKYYGKVSVNLRAAWVETSGICLNLIGQGDKGDLRQDVVPISRLNFIWHQKFQEDKVERSLYFMYYIIIPQRLIAVVLILSV